MVTLVLVLEYRWGRHCEFLVAFSSFDQTNIKNKKIGLHADIPFSHDRQFGQQLILES